MSAVSQEFQIPKYVRDEIERVVRKQLGSSFVSISIKDIEASSGELSIVIEITLREPKTEDLGEKQPSFFGLTRSVRNAMGNVGHVVFPVLRPVSAHA